MIEVRDISIQFDGHTVLDRITHSFASSWVHGIIGLNGAGKTTFFNLMAAVLKPGSGSLSLDGRPLRRKDSGYLETTGYFYTGITGREYLGIFPATNADFNLEGLQELMRLPLDELVETYSTGMKKKLSLLRILKQDRRVYLFDEPFNGLDLESARVMELVIRRLQGKGRTVFVSSHILSSLLNVCDQIHHLSGGRFVRTYEGGDFGEIEQELFGALEKQAGPIVGSSL
jgi:ABC-2 type transport system ATP-binding protein